MAHDVHFSEAYLASLEDAVDNLMLASEAAASRFAEEHDRRVEFLREFPRRGQREGVRAERYSLAVAKSGYRNVYELKGETTSLLRPENVRIIRAR